MARVVWLHTIQWKARATVFISIVKLDVETLSRDLSFWMEAALHFLYKGISQR